MSGQNEAALRLAKSCMECHMPGMPEYKIAAHIRRLVAENEAITAWKDKIIRAAEESHGPAAFRFKLSLRGNGAATNQFPQWLDQRWVSFVYAEDDAHIGLHAKIETLTAQRDELLAVLRLIEHATAPTHDDGAYHENAHELARAAIAKVGGRS